MLTISTKTMIILNEVSNNAFSDKMYNHIILLYRKYNLSVHQTELEFLVNLTNVAKKLLQVLYPKVSDKNIPYMFHHEFIPSDKTRGRIINQFVN